MDEHPRQQHEDAEQAVQDREARLRAILDTAVDGIVTIDERGTIESFNRAAGQIFGYTAAEAVGKNVSILMPESFRDEHDRYLSNYLTSGDVRIIGVGREVDGMRKDGTAFPMDLAVSEFWLGNRRLFTGIVRDISERKQTEERLLQAERLAAIGEAMTGLAHESRNALQRSQSCLEMLARRVEDRPAATDLITRLQKAQDDLHQLYEEVSEYAAPIKLNREPCDLSVILRNAWEHLHVKRKDRKVQLREIKSEELRSESGELNLHCQVDSFTIRQVFRNVLENSLAACEDPVEIEVEYRDARSSGMAAVGVSIRDNGRGLLEADRNKMFDAFFTTKTQGTGLGLAIARRFVEAHAGRISAELNGNGAEIVITLPREVP